MGAIKKGTKLPRPRVWRTLLVVVICAGFAGIGVRMLNSTLAASVSNTMTPTSQTVSTGTNITVTVTTNAGTNHVLTDELRVTFDETKLQFVSADYTGSPLDTDTPQAGAFVGYYQISRYALSTHPTGSFTLAKLTFKVLGTSGTTTLGYDPANSSVFVQEDSGASNALATVAGSTFTLDGVSPTVTITAPANNAQISGSVPFSATATDNTSVSKVEFSVDGALKSTDTTSPYSTTVDATGLSVGSHSMSVTAYDVVGRTSTKTVTVTVADAVKPTLTITSPAMNATVAGTLNVTATATDNISVSKVEFSVDGALKSTDTTSPYAAAIPTASLAAGQHNITVTAYDSAGNTTEKSVTVTINNISGDVNSDGHVTIQDIAILIANYNSSSATAAKGDVNGDGKINIQDLAILISHYGQ